MKKLIALLFAFIPFVSRAYDFCADGICYNIVSSSECEVTSKVSEFYSGSVNIPSTVSYNDHSYSVTSIGDKAFYTCENLTSVTIPNSVKSIGEYAFFWCTSLTSITLPDLLTNIGEGVFCDCTSLTSITLPNSVTSIGDWAFYGCM